MIRREAAHRGERRIGNRAGSVGEPHGFSAVEAKRNNGDRLSAMTAALMS